MAWYVCVLPALGKLKEEESEFKARRRSSVNGWQMGNSVKSCVHACLKVTGFVNVKSYQNQCIVLQTSHLCSCLQNGWGWGRSCDQRGQEASDLQGRFGQFGRKCRKELMFQPWIQRQSGSPASSLFWNPVLSGWSLSKLDEVRP